MFLCGLGKGVVVVEQMKVFYHKTSRSFPAKMRFVASQCFVGYQCFAAFIGVVQSPRWTPGTSWKMATWCTLHEL